jgi:hypothetical protein
MGIAIGNTTDTGALKPTAPGAVTLESWAQGYMVGSLIIMAGTSSHVLAKTLTKQASPWPTCARTCCYTNSS